MDVAQLMANPAMIAGAIVALLFLVTAVVYVLRRARSRRVLEAPPPVAAIPEAEAEAEALREALPPERAPPTETALSAKLSKTRGTLLGRLGKFFGRSSGAIDDAEWTEIEEALLEGDVGISTASILLERVKARLKTANGKPLRDLIVEESEGMLAGLPHGVPDLSTVPKPYVISIVGVNGVGKTTTIGKLANYFKSQGKSVLMGAGDTFRAAAIQQLRVWADRTGSQFVTGREGADPGAVSFDSISAAKARGIDIVLFDTAGRLHTKVNLMDEMKKVHRVMKKVVPEAPHETWLVVDGTLGQNSVMQAREFGKALELTGLIVTKLDGTAKGGAILAAASELKLPVRFIGIGESMEDLVPFEPKPFIGAILGA